MREDFPEDLCLKRRRVCQKDTRSLFWALDPAVQMLKGLRDHELFYRSVRWSIQQEHKVNMGKWLKSRTG